MGLEIGMVVTGKVTGIKKFGAFVTLDDGRSGLVHISEISNSYVSDINDHLQEGQEVKIKVKGIDENGRVDLSIKRAMEPVQRVVKPREENYTRSSQSQSRESSFEDKLKQFMQDSNSKFSGIEMFSNRKGSSRRRSRD